MPQVAPDVVVVLDASGLVLYSNVPSGPLAGAIAAGKAVDGCILGDAGERVADAVRRAIATRRAAAVELCDRSGGDGQPRWYDVRADPVSVPGAGAVIAHLVLTVRDVTDRRRAVETLEESERRFRALVENGNDCIVVISSDDRILYASPALLRSLGYESSDMLGAIASTFVHPDDVPNVSDARATAPGEGLQGVVRLRHKNGSWRWHEGIARNLIDDPAVRGYVCNRLDVTERRQLEEQLRQAQKMEAIGSLAGGVAHDFNNLLAVILGFSDMARHRLRPDDEVWQHVNEVHEAAKRGADLTRKLLAFSRKQIIQLRPIDLGTSVEDFSRMLERVLGEDVHLAVAQSPEPLTVRADPVQLEQVLLNLCNNARQAMPTGGELRLATRVTPLDALASVGRPGRFATIEVSDTGIGMDEATRTRVFEPFFTTKPDGTGLGLATVYGIVEKHGGFVEVESKLGGGTTFRVHLPLAEPDAEAPRAHGAPTEPLTGSELILIAEDEPAVCTLIATTLQALGYRVIATRDGEEAVSAYVRQSAEIDLVVLDVVMPRLDARATYERMCAIRSDLRVLFTTGYAPQSTRIAELLESPHTGLLEKPFVTEELARAVRELIDA